MYLLIDAGNSRLKVALHDGTNWLLRNAIDDAHQLAKLLAPPFQAQHIIISNVAGEPAKKALQSALAAQTAPVEWLQASIERCGLRSTYTQPAQLGPDRWAAAIGAWQHMQSDCLVVSAGTATTIDVVREPGVFAGGCILPGMGLMLDALSSNTAGLPRAPADLPPKALAAPPTDTQSAISAGCLHAQLGAIERLAASLPKGSPILLAGGNAPALAPHLDSRVQLHPWLVMDGLLAIARSKASDPAKN